MAIGDDFKIVYSSKTIERADSPGSTDVYTANALYSWLQDTFDELTQMDDDVPMSAQTPTEYSLINSWVLRKECIPYLKGGGITTIGWKHGDGTGDTYTNGIRILALDGLTNVDDTDIGGIVSGGVTGDTGILVDYETSTNRIWVRSDAADDLFDNTTETITINGDASNAMNGAASTTGEAIWANPYTLGTIETGTIIYIIQNGSKLTHNWYTADYGSNKQSGHLDALILIQEAGTLIDSGDLLVFARRYGDLYDNFSITITTGSRNAVPLATSGDLNNTTAEAYLFYDTETNGGFAADDTIGAGSGTWGSQTADAIVVSVTDWGTEGALALTNIQGTFTDNDALYVMGSTQRGVANGTIGGIWISYDGELGGPFTLNEQVENQDKSHPETAQTYPECKLVGLQDDGATGKMLFDICECHWDDDDVISGKTSSATAAVNGSEAISVRGYEADFGIYQVTGHITGGSFSGTFQNYERVEGGTSGNIGIMIYTDGSTTMTIGNADGQFQSAETITGLESGATFTSSSALTETTYTANKDLNNGDGLQPYDIFLEMNKTEISAEKSTVAKLYEYTKYITRRQSTFTIYDSDKTSAITETDGEQYQTGDVLYTPVKVAPFGTFAGGVFFGARGVWIENMATTDVQAFQLIDSDGDTQIPPNSQSFLVSSLVSGDRIAVYLSTGSGLTAVDKTQYTSHATNNVAGDSDFVITVAIPSDTPFGIGGAGSIPAYIIVVATDEEEEHTYRYASWDTSTFTFPTAITGTGDATGGGSSTTQLTDDAVDFQAGDLEVGDIVYDSTNAEYAYVVSIDSATQITTTAKDTTWLGAAFETNSLVQTYDSGDKAYVPYLYGEASGTSISDTVIYTTDRDVVVRVRKKGILPFQIAQSFTSTGMQQAAIRTTDNIVT